MKIVVVRASKEWIAVNVIFTGVGVVIDKRVDLLCANADRSAGVEVVAGFVLEEAVIDNSWCALVVEFFQAVVAVVGDDIVDERWRGLFASDTTASTSVDGVVLYGGLRTGVAVNAALITGDEVVDDGGRRGVAANAIAEVSKDVVAKNRRGGV